MNVHSNMESRLQRTDFARRDNSNDALESGGSPTLFLGLDDLAPEQGAEQGTREEAGDDDSSLRAQPLHGSSIGAQQAAVQEQG